jgi:uncharacterized membrane protein (UPF0136 family)
MIDLTKLFYFVFGALTIAGGVTGYLTKGSRASLIAGIITGVLILVAAVLIASAKVQPGLILGGIVSLALAFHFIPPFLAKHKFMPAGMMTILSGISIVLTALALFKK